MANYDDLDIEINLLAGPVRSVAVNPPIVLRRRRRPSFSLLRRWPAICTPHFHRKSRTRNDDEGRLENGYDR
jgi:hypothetical protein